MKRISTKVSNIYYGMLAAATVALIDAVGSEAIAQSQNKTIGGISAGVMDDVKQLGQLLMVGCGLGGAGMVAAGLYKLKQAADQGGNGQVKYGDGLWRLGAGACLVAVPAFTGSLTSTFGFGTPTVTQKTIQF